MLLIVSLILIAVVIGGLIVLAFWFRDAADRTDLQMAKQAGDIANLRVENATQAQALATLKDQVLDLSKRKIQRHSDETLDGLDDATAILIDIKLREDALEAYKKSRLDSLRLVLGDIRKGPHAYDSDRPAGMRPEAQS